MAGTGRWSGLVWVLPGLVLGFVLGGVAPRMQLADQDAELARLQDELIKAQRRSDRRSPLSMMGLDRAMAAPEPPADPGTEPLDDVPPDAPEGDAVVIDDVPAEPVVAGPPPDPLQEFDVAVEAQAIRAAQSRQALIDQADLSAGEAADLDAVVTEMNERLAEVADQVVDLVEPGVEPDSRDMLRVTHEVSGILYDAQTAMDDVIGEEAVSEVDPSAREVWNHVDLESFRDAVERADEKWGDDADWGGR